MTDFHQEGTIATLHGLYNACGGEDYLAQIEGKLEAHARQVKISLLLPCLYTELQHPEVLDHIMDEIGKVRYLHSVVIAFNGTADPALFRAAKEYFSRLRTPDREVRLVWVDGPGIQGALDEIRSRTIRTGEKGKGQSVWLALGYMFARGESDVIALHDCDIVTYNRLLPARLIEPVANVHNDFQFSKGYYPRISFAGREMKGRVTRLFVTPFCDALHRVMLDRGFPELERFFSYHRAFRYPLAGEVCFTSRLARTIDFSYDWGLEVATLSEVYRRTNPRKIAQVALVPNYEHKHQDLSPEDPDRGLHRMVVDIGKFYLNYMRSHGVPLDDAFVDMIRHTYYENAKNYIKVYSDDAEINGLGYERHEEELSARYFRDFLGTAWDQCKESRDGTQIASWNRVLYGVPGIYDRILEAVEAENA